MMEGPRDGAVPPSLEAEMADEAQIVDDEDYEKGVEVFDEEDAQSGGGGNAAGAAAEKDDLAANWTSLDNHPEATKTKIRHALARLKGTGRSRLSVLMVGRPGVGKSHTANSLYGTQVAQVVPFHLVTYSNPQPVVIRRRSQGVIFTTIDTPGLVEQDGVSEVNLRRVAFQTRNNVVDVVVYVDRLDMMSDELDLQVLEGIHRTFGPDVWDRMVIGLTRSDPRPPPPGLTQDDFVRRRVEDIRSAMRKAGAKNADIPYTLIENSVRCRLNDSGEKVLDGRPWIPAFFETAVQVALKNPQSGLRFDPGAIQKKRNLLQKLLFVPLAIAAQVLLKVFVLDRLIEDDGTKGDQYGPFDPATMEYEKEKLRERRKQEKEDREAARQKASKLKTQMRKRTEGTDLVVDSSDDDDIFDDDDDDVLE